MQSSKIQFWKFCAHGSIGAFLIDISIFQGFGCSTGPRELLQFRPLQHSGCMRGQNLEVQNEKHKKQWANVWDSLQRSRQLHVCNMSLEPVLGSEYADRVFSADILEPDAGASDAVCAVCALEMWGACVACFKLCGRFAARRQERSRYGRNRFSRWAHLPSSCLEKVFSEPVLDFLKRRVNPLDYVSSVVLRCPAQG